MAGSCAALFILQLFAHTPLLSNDWIFCRPTGQSTRLSPFHEGERIKVRGFFRCLSISMTRPSPYPLPGRERRINRCKDTLLRANRLTGNDLAFPTANFQLVPIAVLKAKRIVAGT